MEEKNYERKRLENWRYNTSIVLKVFDCNALLEYICYSFFLPEDLLFYRFVCRNWCDLLSIKKLTKIYDYKQFQYDFTPLHCEKWLIHPQIYCWQNKNKFTLFNFYSHQTLSILGEILPVWYGSCSKNWNQFLFLFNISQKQLVKFNLNFELEETISLSIFPLEQNNASLRVSISDKYILFKNVSHWVVSYRNSCDLTSFLLIISDHYRYSDGAYVNDDHDLFYTLYYEKAKCPSFRVKRYQIFIYSLIEKKEIVKFAWEEKDTKTDYYYHYNTNLNLFYRYSSISPEVTFYRLCFKSEKMIVCYKWKPFFLSHEVHPSYIYFENYHLLLVQKKSKIIHKYHIAKLQKFLMQEK